MDELNELKRLAGLKVPEKLDEILDFDDEQDDVNVSTATTSNQNDKDSFFKQDINKRVINPVGDVKFTSLTKTANGPGAPKEIYSQSVHKNLGPDAI